MCFFGIWKSLFISGKMLVNCYDCFLKNVFDVLFNILIYMFLNLNLFEVNLLL